MRILYASFDEVPSFKGASTHILAGLRGAIRHAHVTLVTLGESRLPRSIHSSCGLNHRPFALREQNYLKRGLLFRSRVRDIVSSEVFDVAHFRGPFEGVAIIESGLPAVYEVNAFPSIELRYYYGDLPEHIVQKFREWESVCLRGAQKIICPSERLRECILEREPKIDRSKIVVLRNGYDPIPTLQISRNTLLSSPLRGVYVGTLSPWQGILWALKAFRDVSVPLTLDIYAPYNKIQWRRATRRIERYGLSDRVRLLPAILHADICATLQQYDFALAPLMKTERNTTQGCCPLKILDYMAAGIPIIASDLFVVRELLSDPEYELLFSPGRVLSLRAKLEWLYAHYESIPSIKGRIERMLLRVPTWTDYNSTLLSLYHDLGAQGAPPLPGSGSGVALHST